jgi:hypothetical protein
MEPETSTNQVDANFPTEQVDEFTSQSTSTDEVEAIGKVNIWAILVPVVLLCVLGVGICVVIKRKSLRTDKFDTV